jgi:hypothetical protein
MNFPPNTKIAAYWCHPHFPKAVKTTPQPLIYSPHKYKTARHRHFENQIEYWTSLYLLASIHPPTPAKKYILKSTEKKKFTSCHPRNLLSQSDFQQLADCEPYEMHYVLKMSITLMQETCLWNLAEWKQVERVLWSPTPPNSTPSTDILKSSFTRKRRRRRRRRNPNPNPNPNSFAWH